MNNILVPTTSLLVKKHGLNAKKSLGQNFIFDSNLTDKIARSAGDLSTFEVLEIGPGPGGLTKSILKYHPKKLVVIERDPRFITALLEIKSFYNDHLLINQADALKINELELFGPDKFKIIANLPYNIGTKLLFKWLKICPRIESMTLLFQKEVAERIVAKPNSKKYGRLGVMVNFLCETEYLFDIAPSAFVPAPKVVSALVKIKPRPEPLMNIDIEILSKIVASAFNQRRKMIRSSLKAISSDVVSWLEKCAINPNLRAEQLSLEQFGKLTEHYVHI